MTVKKNYESYAQELKDKAKENKNDDKGKKSAKKRKMYISFGSSMKSEKEAFDNAINFIKTVDVKLKSVRLDKYYSESSVMFHCLTRTQRYTLYQRMQLYTDLRSGRTL